MSGEMRESVLGQMAVCPSQPREAFHQGSSELKSRYSVWTMQIGLRITCSYSSTCQSQSRAIASLDLLLRRMSFPS